MSKIKERREALGMSQQDLAERLGVSQGAVSQWELGSRFPRRDKIIELSAMLDLTAAEILGMNGHDVATDD